MENFESAFTAHFHYRVYEPKNVVPGKKYPLILSLHGAGERGESEEDFKRIENIGLPRYLRDGLIEMPECFILAPQCPGQFVWSHLIFQLKDLLDKVISEYPIDPDRVCCTGMSMGGYGTWEMGIKFPHTFSCIAPICGGGMAWRAGNLKGQNVWAFHGSADGAVRIQNSEDMVQSARCAGANIKFTVFEGVNHNSWDSAYLETKLIDWMLSQKRQPQA